MKIYKENTDGFYFFFRDRLRSRLKRAARQTVYGGTATLNALYYAANQLQSTADCVWHVKKLVGKFETLSKDLSSADFFNSTKASVHDAFSVTTNAKAVAGNYTVHVTQLAQAQSLTTQKEITDQSAQLGTTGATDRKISITQGNPAKTVDIPLKDNQTSLLEMRDAINGAKAGVKASIVRVGDNQYQLALTSSATGSANQMSVQVSGDDRLGSYINYTAGSSSNAMKETVAAQDSIIEMNGTK